MMQLMCMWTRHECDLKIAVVPIKKNDTAECSFSFSFNPITLINSVIGYMAIPFFLYKIFY